MPRGYNHLTMEQRCLILGLKASNFLVSKISARTGRNPATGKEMDIAARNQARFKVGSKLKAACNK